MDNLQLQQNNLQPTIWETNPKLKALLLVLIFVFLFSGVGLVVFAQWGGTYREKLYEETQAALPKHTPSQPVNQPVTRLPSHEGEANGGQGESASTTTSSDIAGWKTYKNDEYGFEFQYPLSFSDFNSYPTSNSNYIFNIAATSTRGSIGIRISPESFDPSNVKSLYGKIENPEKINVGRQVGYGFINGDGGCGGWFVQTFLTNKTIEISFGSCEGDQGTSLYSDKALIDEILSTFKFTK